MELQLITARWTIRIARNKPAKPSPPAATQYPMRVSTPLGFGRRTIRGDTNG
mgnify:CR=1 FL=1